MTRTKRGGRPTKQDSERLAAQIVDTARALFISQGFAATTMEQVIDACGIGKDTLYRRFSTKEDLFAEVARAAATRTLAWFESMDRDSPAEPLARVRHLARWFLDANLDPELLALKREAFIEAMRTRPLVQDDAFTPRLVEAIAAAHSAGTLTAPDPAFTAAQLIAAVVLGPNNDALMGSDALGDPADREAWFDRAWQLFVAGAGA
ncbi:putative acrAB operon repressor [Marinibacterium anthonyi]|nr:putative acrAB operon repressor [Marinibacterium anthonyi]